MPKPRPKTTKRDPDAIAHVLDTVSDDAADLKAAAPPPAAPKQVAKKMSRPIVQWLVVEVVTPKTRLKFIDSGG